MDFSTIQLVIFAILSFAASTVTGAVGYGFSSIVTPVATLFTSNRILNPALVPVEFASNISILFSERRLIKNTWKRAIPIAVGLAPGVVIGSLVLVLLSTNNIKLILYVVLLPLVFLQIIGKRWPIKHERKVGPAFGGLLGVLYSLTTVSGPPLALFWRNQGLSKNEFRCTVAQIRVAESSFTLISYGALGLFSASSLSLILMFGLPILVGIPFGRFLLKRVSNESFGRVAMAVDAILISFGLTQVFNILSWINPVESYILFGILSFIILLLLYFELKHARKEITF